jgi:hypothetical protein
MMGEEIEKNPVADRQERWAALLQGESIRELRALTREQLIEKHDVLVEEANRSKKPAPAAKLQWLERAQVYADELARRENARQGERMEALTRSLNWLTWVITGATIVGVVLTAVGLLFGG